ncbi:proton-conducting transporter membrane subunit [Arthrobacter sp. VKM Ac-2550]|uniref:proton-conducting transporter transmembrane domain-containing protein n=1 Tax=Crystallibacter permensis TaxID=1938888 RepID=UPI002227D3E2|nr:proton-conducting transporter membrane subunit [Arthrobacter sp. VKM Ac-2550]MCW2134131.1 NADH:ubiquinone oxidoreductase subunit 5 (chain L)/Multisubunit Na+/H+ antiporter, MnhA subunit [Arthrobacter sp. VKM Ac-2550]
MTAVQAALLTLVLLPAAVGVLLALVRGTERVATPVAVVTAGLTTAMAFVVALARPSLVLPFMVGADFSLAVDALAALVVPAVAAVTFLVLVFAAGNIRESRSRFHGLMLIFSAAALATATAASIPALLFAWELMGATSYALIGFWWRNTDRVAAGLTAFVTTRTADLGLYVAAGAALAGGAGMALADLPAATDPWRHVITAGILVAALGKAAQLPFSFWLSGAMKGPSPVSALLHSAAMVAMGGYLLLRVEPLLASTGWAGPLAAWIGVVTAVLMGVVALAQRELKQLLAASTVAQMGFVVLAAGVGAVSGGAAHLVAHASTKALLFLAAGAWLTALGTGELAGLRGVGRRWRVVGVAATLGALALAGIAPLSLWATKDAVLAAALGASPWLYAAGLVAAALSAAYAGKALWTIWRRGQREEAEEGGTGEVGALERTPLVVLAAGAAVLGVLALPPISGTLAGALGGHGEVALTELLVSAGIALVVLLAMFRWRAPEPGWARQWLRLEHTAHAVVVRPALALARALARFDDRVLDRAALAAARAVAVAARAVARFDDRVLDAGVEASAATADATGRGAARLDDARVDGAVEGLAGRVRRLGEIARAPQTGAVHQYLLQAVAVLAVGVLAWFVYAVMG